MNQSPIQTQTPNRNLFEGAFESLNEFEKAEAQNDYVQYSPERNQSITSDWESYLQLRTEIVNEGPVERKEISFAQTETNLSSQLNTFSQSETADLNPDNLIKKQKGSGSILEEAGLKLDFAGLGKEIGKGIFGAFSIFKEIFTDTLTLVVGKKEKRGEKSEIDPEKARAKAEKKAENQKKQNNIKAFYEGLKSQTSAVISADIKRMQINEESNINLTAKIGQESYKGIKDSFGRLTVYASSLFVKAQLDHEKKAKKQEKEMKIASVGKGPDLNMDKVAEGGYLSSTGGQGAG